MTDQVVLDRLKAAISSGNARRIAGDSEIESIAEALYCEMERNDPSSDAPPWKTLSDQDKQVYTSLALEAFRQIARILKRYLA